MYHEVHSGSVGNDLRAAAVRRLAESCEPIDSVATWRDLTEGNAYIVDEFTTTEGAFLILQNRIGSARALSRRDLEILERVLLGVDQKVVGIERSLAPSTVAACLRQAYGKIGLTCKPSRVSLFMVTLVHAAKGRGRIESGRACKFEYEGTTFRALRMTMPERVFARVLSPAEEAVVRMRVQGRSHAEIAARRKTSLRTVANQVAAAFQRLGISSRSDLMELLILPDGLPPTPPRAPTRAPYIRRPQPPTGTSTAICSAPDRSSSTN